MGETEMVISDETPTEVSDEKESITPEFEVNPPNPQVIIPEETLEFTTEESHTQMVIPVTNESVTPTEMVITEFSQTENEEKGLYSDLEDEQSDTYREDYTEMVIPEVTPTNESHTEMVIPEITPPSEESHTETQVRNPLYPT